MSGLIDLTGVRFGKLLVIKRAENTNDNRAKWECLCDCGNTKIIRMTSLKAGTKSCGCLTRNKNYPIDLSGLRFGKWTVIKKGERVSCGNSCWLCKCDCGKEKEVQRPSLINRQSIQCRECSNKPKYIGKMYKHYFTLMFSRVGP